MEKIEHFYSIIGTNIMIYCDELPFRVLSTYHYFNIETMNTVPFYPGEDEPLFEMDVDEYKVEFNKLIDNLKNKKK